MTDRTAVRRSRLYLGFASVAGAFSAIVSALIVDGLNDGDWSLGAWEWPETVTAALVLILAVLWVAPPVAARIALVREPPERELIEAQLERRGYQPSRKPPLAATRQFALELRPWTSIRKRRALGQDADFDRLGEGFENVVYGSSMGDVRLAVILDDVLENVPLLREGRMRVLDVGGGAGRFALQLAALGNEVVLADPSREMLDRAESAIERAGLSDSIAVIQAGIQDLDGILGERFEMVACHAVLNWVADPESALEQLERLLASAGTLSLTFGTRTAWLFQKILDGDFTEVLSDPDPDSLRARHARDMRFPWLSQLPPGWSELGWGESPMPLSENAVRGWLEGLGLVVRSKAGIRMFHDYLAESLRTPDRMDALIEVENALRHSEPFASLGTQVHFVCSRQQDPKTHPPIEKTMLRVSVVVPTRNSASKITRADEARLLHDEDGISLVEHLRKKFYYGRAAWADISASIRRSGPSKHHPSDPPSCVTGDGSPRIPCLARVWSR